MKASAFFTVAKLPIVALAAVVLTLAGCLITSEAVGDGGLLFFGSLSVDNGRGAIVLSEAPQRHYRSIRIAASSYPVQVYRVVIVYRDGGEASYVVGWRFTDRIRYHDLHVRSDRGIREIHLYQRPIESRGDRHGRWKGGENEKRGPAGQVLFRIYGLE